MNKQVNYRDYQSGGSIKLFAIMAFLGFLSLAIPFALPFIIEKDLSGGQIAVMITIGLILIVVGGILLLMSKLYLKAPSNEALVITGMGGMRVMLDGGGLFIPMFQQLMVVPLETMKIQISRRDNNAFITADNLRANMTSEFYIKIPKEQEDIITAATTLGDKGVDSDQIKNLVEEKLVSTLRNGVAIKTLNELHVNRTEFANQIKKDVLDDLKANGLQLETVTISDLDQAPMHNLEQNNVFNAQGLQAAAEIIQTALTKRNEIERDNELLRKMKDVGTRKLLDKEQINVESSAAIRDQEIEVVRAEQNKVAKEKAAEYTEAAEKAEIKKELEVQKANVDKEKAVELEIINKEKAVAVENENREKAKEEARVDKEIAVAQKTKKKAEADIEVNKARASAQKEEEAIATVKVQEGAERNKIERVIQKEAEAQEKVIVENANADIEAYAKKKLAEADKEAAENMAEAIRVEAQANKDASILRAEGQKAQEMVPVDVDKAKVKVEAERVEVTKKDLEYKARYDKISVEYELGIKEIEANKEVGIAQANAMGEAIKGMDIQIFGDNTAYRNIMSAFHSGQTKGMFIEGFTGSLPAGTNTEKIGENLLKQYLTGQEMAMGIEGFTENVPDEVMELIKRFTSGAGDSAGLSALAGYLLGKDAKESHVKKLEQLLPKDEAGN